VTTKQQSKQVSNKVIKLTNYMVQRSKQVLSQPRKFLYFTKPDVSFMTLFARARHSITVILYYEPNGRFLNRHSCNNTVGYSTQK